MPRGIYLHRSPSLATRVSMSESHKGHQTTQNTRDSISKANKGREPWNKGKTKDQYSQLSNCGYFAKGHTWNVGKECKQYTRNLISGANTGKKRSEETKKVLSLRAKQYWCVPGNAEMMLSRMLGGNNARPTKPEKQVIQILKSLLSDIKYVGDGKCWKNGMNPDFIDEDKNQIIEVYGCFWHCCRKCGHHNRNRIRQKDASRIKNFKKLGYSVLIVWEHELKSSVLVINKIQKILDLR